MEKQSVREKIYKLKNKKVSDRDECKFNLVLRLVLVPPLSRTGGRIPATS